MISVLVVLGYIVFVLVLVAGVLATLVGLPGSVLILADAVVFSAFTHWRTPNWKVLVVLALISLVAETSDNLVSAAGVKQGGGSGKTGVWAMLGGIGGALVGSWLSPLLGLLGVGGGIAGFVFGALLPPLAMAMVGGYLAAYWYERRQGRSEADARKAGAGALVGRLLGGMAKGLLAAIMAAILLSIVF